jgi:Uma2 family endonuclease
VSEARRIPLPIDVEARDEIGKIGYRERERKGRYPMATASPLQSALTAGEFARRPDPGYPEELVKGRIVRLPPPGSRHGFLCSEFAWLLRSYLEEHDLGRVLTNDSGVITQRNPDSVRGADVAYYSYNRLPRGPLPVGYPEVVPELVVEVRSPSDRWPTVLVKIAEYLDAGVGIGCVLDDVSRTVQVYDAERPLRIFNEGDELAFPELLPGFAVNVRRVFE